MAGRYFKSSSGRAPVPASLTALLALASAGTASASTGLVPCDDTTIGNTRALAATRLHAANVNHEVESTALEPSTLIPTNYPDRESATESALLQGYDENAEASTDEFAPVGRAESEDSEQPLIKARVPGVSDSDLARYKRNMFRRDI
ncbi:MAG: hypothetical protein WBN44_09130 [Woeseiaceae bacterium]